jgi:hypothetical protein
MTLTCSPFAELGPKQASERQARCQEPLRGLEVDGVPDALVERSDEPGRAHGWRSSCGQSALDSGRAYALRESAFNHSPESPHLPAPGRGGHDSGRTPRWVAGSEKAAAHRVGLSHSTVKHHLATARSKVGDKTTAQLVWILAPRLPEAIDANPEDE